MDNLFGSVQSVSCLGLGIFPNGGTSKDNVMTLMQMMQPTLYIPIGWRYRCPDQLFLVHESKEGWIGYLLLMEHMVRSRWAYILRYAASYNTPKPVWNPDVPNQIDFQAS